MSATKVDIVMPDGNEKELIGMAKRLGYTHLILAYDLGNKNEAQKLRENIDGLQGAGVALLLGLITKAQEIDKATGLCDIVLYKADGNDRQAMERSARGIIFGLELVERKDSMHARRSGLNHVLCRICHEKEKMVAFSFGDVLGASSWQRAIILGRMMQNSDFCRRFKVRTSIASFAREPYGMRAPHDLIAWGIALGMHPKDAKDSVSLDYTQS